MFTDIILFDQHETPMSNRMVAILFFPITGPVLSQLISGLFVPSREYKIRSSTKDFHQRMNLVLEDSSVVCPGSDDHADLTDSRLATFVGGHRQSIPGYFVENLHKVHYLLDIY